jgi:hypothetical protein
VSFFQPLPFAIVEHPESVERAEEVVSTRLQAAD